MDLASLKGFFIWCLGSLLGFQFNFFNPLFWVIILVSFSALRRYWEFKNAAGFILTSSLILLASTWFEGRIRTAMAASGERFDPVIFRLLVVFVIIFLFFAYTFLRESMKYGVFSRIRDTKGKGDGQRHKH